MSSYLLRLQLLILCPNIVLPELHLCTPGAFLGRAEGQLLLRAIKTNKTHKSIPNVLHFRSVREFDYESMERFCASYSSNIANPTESQLSSFIIAQDMEPVYLALKWKGHALEGDSANGPNSIFEWAPWNPPVDSDDEMCVRLNSDQFIELTDCSELLKVVCEIDSDVLSSNHELEKPSQPNFDVLKSTTQNQTSGKDKAKEDLLEEEDDDWDLLFDEI